MREKSILPFTSAGKVNEYRLRYRVGFRVTDSKGAAGVPADERDPPHARHEPTTTRRSSPRKYEEALLYRDMQTDMVQQIMRRLVAAQADVRIE